MSQSLVTICTYWDAVEARLAKVYLEQAGIRAVLQNENAVTMDWLAFANASKGVQLQVETSDVVSAIEVLERKSPQTEEIENEWDTPEETTTEEDEATPQESVSSPPLSPEVDDEKYAPLNLREQRIERAYLASKIGIVFSPVVFYATYLLGLVAISEEPIRSTLHKLIWRAVAINGFMMGLLFLAAYLLNWY